MAMLTGYFDESGTHADAQICTIAGFVGEQSTWEHLEKEWSEILGRLADRGVTWFHMTECVGGTGQFCNVTFEQRRALIGFLTGVINRNDVTAVWAGVNTRDFDEFVCPGSAFGRRFPKPYDLCFHEVMIQVCGWAVRHGRGSAVNLVFAEQTEFKQRTCNAWRGHPARRGVLGSLIFDSPKHSVPLQTADMLAFEVTKDWERIEQIGACGVDSWSDLAARSVLDKISHGGSLQYGGLYDEGGLKTAIANFGSDGKLWGS